MRAVAQWPPRTHDTGAVVAAYERVLGWPLIVRATFVSAERAAAELAGSTDVELSTTCSAFDAVTVSHTVGVETLVLLGRRDFNLVPCLTEGHDRAVFLVQAGTGEALTATTGVSVASGPGGRLVLPPSPRRRWDTPPWNIRTEEPCPLPAGAVIEPCLRAALQLFPACHPEPGRDAASTTVRATFGEAMSHPSATVADRARSAPRGAREKAFGHLLTRLDESRASTAVAEAEETDDLLEAVQGVAASPGRVEIAPLAAGLESVLQTLCDNSHRVVLRHAGPDMETAVSRARKILSEPPGSAPDLGRLRRLAHAISMIRDLAGDTP